MKLVRLQSSREKKRTLGRKPASQRASESAASFVWGLTKGSRNARQSSARCARASQSRAPSGARWRTPASRQHMAVVPRKSQQLVASQLLLRTTTAPDSSAPCNWNTFLAKSSPIVTASFTDGSLCLIQHNTRSAHLDADLGRPPHPPAGSIPALAVCADQQAEDRR